MNKCQVNEDSLKLIDTQVAKAARTYRKNHLTVSELRDSMIKVFEDCSQYDLEGIDIISERIYNTCKKWGVVDLNSEFFNPLNIRNLIIRISEGVQLTNSLDTSTDKLTDTEEVKLRSEVNSAFLDNAYGLASGVKTYATNLENQHIFDCCFINRGSLGDHIGIVTNTAELNLNIRNYQEALLLKICAYLNSIIRLSRSLTMSTSSDIRALLSNPHLYAVVDGEVLNTGILEKLSGLINTYLSSEVFNSAILKQLYNTAHNNTLTDEERSEALLRLDAYNANVFLKHFDSYLTTVLGKAIQIKDFNRKTGRDKYQISDTTSNLLTSWRRSENIMVEDEADAVTKLAINTTPLYMWLGDSPINGLFLNFIDFEHCISKIKDLSYNETVLTLLFDDNFIQSHLNLWDSLTKNTRDFLYNKALSQAINSVRRNPRLQLHHIFEILSNSEFYELYRSSFMDNKHFTTDELNKLYSISRGIFNPQFNNSLYSLSGYGTDFYSYITLTADSIFNVHYIQYFKDENGIISCRTLIDLGINNIRRSIEVRINSSNSIKLIKDFGDYKLQLLLSENNGIVSFTIPNTNISVNVTLSSQSTVFKEGDKIVPFTKLWENKDFAKFVLSTLLLDENTLPWLRPQYNSYNEMYRSLSAFASRVIANRFISLEEVLEKENKDEVIKSIYGEGGPKYNYGLNEMGLVSNIDVPTLKNIAIARSNELGLTSSSLVKDGQGNGQSLQTLSRLLGSLQSQFDLQEKLPDSATNGCILLSVPGLYEGVYTVKEFHSNDENKETTLMSVSEMASSLIIYDFVGGLLPSDSTLIGNGHILLLPSVNSDKNTIGRIKINLNKEVIDSNGLKKRLRDFTNVELEQLISREIGNIYTRMVLNIVSDWKTVTGFLKENYNYAGPDLGLDFFNNFENFNKYIRTLPDQTPVEFIKEAVKTYNESHRLNPITLIDQVHFKEKGGNLRINETILAQISRFNPSFYSNAKYPSAEQFFNAKKLEVLKSALKSGFEINTSNTNLLELLYIRNTYPNWINRSGNMILAKIKMGNQTLSVTSNGDLSTLLELSEVSSINDLINLLGLLYPIELNPLLEQYNYLDYLFTLEFMISTVGSFIAHPDKSKSANVLELEASQFGALHKRNVSYTAAMHEFQLNMLTGIPEYYNIAVVEDIKDHLGTITGDISTIKPFDGATFVNPFVVILENNSLCGAKAGITKKLFVHFKDHRTGTGGIIKTAGFGLTNDWIRNSPFLYHMMLKMTNHTWLNEEGAPIVINVTWDYKGSKVLLKPIYFKKGSLYYLVTSITSLGNNTYQRTLLEIKQDGTLIGNPIVEEAQVINTNYSLWNYFGGEWSMEMKANKLVPSNTSVENVVTTMNGVGVIRGNATKIETQDLLWLPLKMSDIHYVPTAGAVKLGAANINPASAYTNNSSLDILRIHMYLAGIQLDKEHHADDSELSLMTLVISACAARGYTFEVASKLYNALHSSTEVGIREHLDAVINLFLSGEVTNTDIQEVIMESLVKALGNTSRGSNNFAQIVATDLMNLAKSGKKIKYSDALIPLSDNNIYALVLSTLSSYLTSSGIKQKIPGILSVLTPSYNIFKLYAGRKYESFDNPEEELEALQALQVPIYDVNDSTSNIANLELGRSYRIVDLGVLTVENPETGETAELPVEVERELPLLIRTPLEYYELKKAIASGNIARVTEDITVGRDLAGYNVRFLTIDGVNYQLWDLDSASALFKLNELEENWSGIPADIEVLQNIYQELFDKPITIPIEQGELFLENIKKGVRRRILHDLANLSKNSPDIMGLYERLLDTFNGDYSRYARLVNLWLGTNNGLLIRLGDGRLVTINSDNFSEIEPFVRLMIDYLTMVKVNGEWKKVNKQTISELAYELIMPKTFATNFGLTEFDSLEEISSNPNYFVEQYKRNFSTKVLEKLYDVELKSSNGLHQYLLLKKHLINSDLIRLEILDIYIDGKRYRTDFDGNTMYELSEDAEVFSDSLGNEVIVTDNFDPFINNMHYDSIKLSSALSIYPSTVRSIVSILQKSKKRIAKQFAKYITSNGIIVDNILKLNSDYNTDISESSHIFKLLRSKHTSFLLALKTVAARIPAQSMQSFMPMKVVAFDNPNINTAYVSTYLILLLGSDYDVDAVSIATFDIDRNGLLQLWSPYSNIESKELLDASLRLPFPTGRTIAIEEFNPENAIEELKDRLLLTIENIINFVKRGNLFNINSSYIWSKDLKSYVADPNKVEINLNLDTPSLILLMKHLLEVIPYFKRPTTLLLSQVGNSLLASGVLQFKPSDNQVNDIFTKLEEIYNKHNLYLDDLSLYNVSKVVNNYMMSAMYDTIIDPVNLIEAQTSVDGTTGPLKRVANNSPEALEAKFRTPGNFMNKYESIVENQVGKEAIGICAVGLKSFFGLTLYNNYILNYGSSEDLGRLLLGDGGITIGGKTYRTVANIRAMDPNSITNQAVLDALSHTTNDEDMALTLSALLSLATDNAKELSLAKLNAGTKMIGLYIYGITIGMNFKDVAKILMSPSGNVIKGLLDSNVFSGKSGYNRVNESLFKYFEEGPNRQLKAYNIFRDLNGEEILSPLKALEQAYEREYPYKDKNGLQVALAESIKNLARTPKITLARKIGMIEKLRNSYSSNSKYGIERYNQLLDFVENYILQGHIIGLDLDNYNDIRTLSEGAEEMRILGRILSINQGLKTKSDEFSALANLIIRAIYNKTGNEEDLIDLTRFALDSEYRLECINSYETVKHSFNILDVATRTPHFLGYLTTLAVGEKELQSSYKYRSVKANTLKVGSWLSPKNPSINESDIIKGLQRFIGDKTRRDWMYSSEINIRIPKGNKAFDKNGNEYTLKEDQVVSLGTDWGDATFRLWMEQQVIPDLKSGRIKPGKTILEVSSNQFILLLTNDLLTNTISHNPTIVYTLPINMLPRTDVERVVFDRLLSEFNKLSELSYQYTISEYLDNQLITRDSAPIPIVDLFTYYAMIADSWRLSEKSLVPILRSFEGSGIIEDFHKYEKALDLSGEILDVEDIERKDILPYVVLGDSPYSAYSPYIRGRDPRTKRFGVMTRLTRNDYENLDEDLLSLITVGSYYRPNIGIDTNYFTSGVIENSNRVLTISLKSGEKAKVYIDLDTSNISTVNVNGVSITIPKEAAVYTKVNGKRAINVSLLESIINNLLNPC